MARRQIEHAKQRHGTALVEDLSSVLRAPDIDNDVRMALLNLAGGLSDPRLLPAIQACWTLDEGRSERLDDYLWAFSFCCTPETAEEALGPLCAEWSVLPEEKQGDAICSPRNEVADDEIRWTFERRPPGPAINYLVKRGEQEDLSWQIYYLLHGVDHPEAIRFCVAAMARAHARSDQGYFINFRKGQDHWDRYAEEHGIYMSGQGRAQLRDIWQDTARDEHERIPALDLWASSWGEDDLGHLRSWQDDPILSDRILRRRLEREDAEAIPLLLPKLDGEKRRY